MAEIFGGIAILVLFGVIETKVAYPMFRLQLFKIRAFTAASSRAFWAALSRGGLMFMLVIWLQGIWLPLHGYSFEQHPALGRDLHDPVDHRAVARCAAQRSPGRSLRRATLRHRWASARGAHLRPADHAAGRLSPTPASASSSSSTPSAWGCSWRRTRPGS